MHYYTVTLTDICTKNFNIKKQKVKNLSAFLYPRVLKFYSSSLLESGNMVSFLHKTLAMESLITTTVGWFEKAGIIVEYKGGEIK